MTRFDTIETYEPGDTKVFTWQASYAPDNPPHFTVWDQSSSVVASVTATQSDSLNYYALYTMPGSNQHMVAEFKALKTVAGSAYQDIVRDTFRVRQTGPTG